jgi:methylmalonyl-CoA mutase C-terminal domain/subunit
MVEERKIRVLVAKPGLDGHERGARVVAYGLRDEGFEVVYTGLRQTADQIAVAALQEDVDVVGLSILSGAHLSLTKKVMDRLIENGGDDILLLVGGIIPEKDIPALKEIGVGEVFTSGTSIPMIAEYIRNRMNTKAEEGSC